MKLPTEAIEVSLKIDNDTKILKTMTSKFALMIHFNTKNMMDEIPYFSIKAN